MACSESFTYLVAINFYPTKIGIGVNSVGPKSTIQSIKANLYILYRKEKYQSELYCCNCGMSIFFGRWNLVRLDFIHITVNWNTLRSPAKDRLWNVLLVVSVLDVTPVEIRMDTMEVSTDQMESSN